MSSKKTTPKAPKAVPFPDGGGEWKPNTRTGKLEQVKPPAPPKPEPAAEEVKSDGVK